MLCGMLAKLQSFTHYGASGKSVEFKRTWFFRHWDPALHLASASAWKPSYRAWTARRARCTRTAGGTLLTRHIYSLGQSIESELCLGREATYSKLPCRRSAIGASGLIMTLHASGTSTSRMALRLTRRVMDLDPRVATSLWLSDGTGENDIELWLRGLPDGCDTVLGRRED